MAHRSSAKVVEDDDVEASIAEAELAKLQRQYRIAEGDRKAYTEEAQYTLRKQKINLDNLRQDNEHLKRELAAVESTFSHAQQADKKLRELEAKSEGYKAEIEVERELLAELDKQIAAAERKVRTSTKTISRGKEAGNSAVAKQITTVENRLEKTLRDFNTILTQNSTLRETIDHLKQERKVFDNIYKKLEKELHDQKKQMAEVIEKSNQAYEARDEAQNKIAALKEKAEKEISQYTMEIKELTRVLEHDRKLRSFMGVKSQDRGGKEFTVSMRKNANEREQNPEELIKTYEEAFSKIKTSTGIDDIDRLVTRFIEVEDHNFALFNFVNELSNEIEGLQEQISDIQSKGKKLTSENEALDKQRQTKLKTLESKLAAAQAKAATHKQRQAATMEELESLKRGVSSLFHKIKCDKQLLQDRLGNDEISDSNILQFLSLIEKKSNELLYLKGILDAKAHGEWLVKESTLRDKADENSDVPFDPIATLGPKPVVTGLLGTGPRVNKTQAKMQIQPPSTGDDDDVISEDEENPLSHAELKAKFIKGIAKRMATSSATKGSETVSSSVGSRSTKKGR